MTMLTDVPVKARPCPRCGGTEHRAVPAYDEDDETLDVVSVFRSVRAPLRGHDSRRSDPPLGAQGVSIAGTPTSLRNRWL